MLCKDRYQGGVLAEHAFFFMRQPTVASGGVSCISCSHGTHVEIWSPDVVWQFMCCVWVLLEEYCELDSSGDAVLLWRNAWLDVGCLFCISLGYLAVTCSVSGCCMRSTENWIIPAVTRAQSSVQQWIHVLEQYGSDDFTLIST